MKVVIIEDEIRSALQLEKMIQDMDKSAVILDILESVTDSVKWFRKNECPDLVFMDIQLADGLSFEIFQQTVVDCPVIFTTAYDQYSIRAFKVNSIDYLLKPLKSKDLENALIKYHDLRSRSNKINSATIELLISNLAPSKSRKRFVVKEGQSLIFIQVEDISFFYSEDGLSFLMTQSGKRYVLDLTLDQIEKDLDADNFFRINRGQIVNIQVVRKIKPYLNHRLILDIAGQKDTEFVVSRSKATPFKNWVAS